MIFGLVEIDWKDIPIIDWESISAMALIITAVAIWFQALNTKKLAETTLKPRVSVGIMSFDKSLGGTRIIINNYSNFTAFVWTKLNLKINNKNANDYLKSSDFCSGKRAWEMDPSRKIHPFILDPSILEHKEKKITIDISFYCSSDSELPKNPKWVKLNTYSFRSKERQWLKDGIGVPYLL